MLAAPFMTRRLTKEFIEKNGRSPTKDEFIAIQHEAVNTLINNNSVYGILGQGGTKMSEIVSKGKPTEEQVVVLSRDIKVIYTPKPFGECEHPDTTQNAPLDPKVAFTSYREQEHEDQLPPPPPLEIELSGKKPNFLPSGIRDRNSLKIMTKEMYENFVKQGKKFVTFTGQVFDSLEETGIDLDGDTIIVDGQKYFVNMKSWYLGRK